MAGCEMFIFHTFQPQKLPDPMGDISFERRKMVFGFLPFIFFSFFSHFSFFVLLHVSPLHRYTHTYRHTDITHAHRHTHIHTHRHCTHNMMHTHTYTCRHHTHMDTNTMYTHTDTIHRHHAHRRTFPLPTYTWVNLRFRFLLYINGF